MNVKALSGTSIRRVVFDIVSEIRQSFSPCGSLSRGDLPVFRNRGGQGVGGVSAVGVPAECLGVGPVVDGGGVRDLGDGREVGGCFLWADVGGQKAFEGNVVGGGVRCPELGWWRVRDYFGSRWGRGHPGEHEYGSRV